MNAISNEDAALLEKLGAAAFEPGTFTHEHHVRSAVALLRRDGLVETLRTLPAMLRRFAAKQGKPEIYHETLTWGWILLVHDRLEQTAAESFEAFARVHPDLLRRDVDPIARQYRPATFASDRARRTFVWPDAR